MSFHAVMLKLFFLFSVKSSIRGYQFTYDSRYPSQDHKVLLNKSPEECADSCEAETSFPCRSFDYERALKKCYLSKAIAGDGDLIVAKGFDFYQTGNYNKTFYLAVASLEIHALTLIFIHGIIKNTFTIYKFH